MSKYAPAREDGLKPYVVVTSPTSAKGDRIIYAQSQRMAEKAWLADHPRRRFARAWRATPEDMTAHQEEK